MNKSTLGALGLALTGMVTLSACGSGSGGSSDTFTLGAVQPLSGPFSSSGLASKAGIELAVKEINDDGGICKRKVKLVVRDDGSDPSKSRLATQDVVEKEGASAVVPSLISPLALAALPYTSQRKIITIAGNSTPDLGDPKKNPYHFIVGDLSSKRVEAVAAAVQKLKGQKIGILASTTTAQAAFGDGLGDYAKKLGLDVVANDRVNGESTDLSPQLQKLRAAGADTVVFDAQFNNSINVVMTGMQSIGWTAPVVTPPEMISGDLSSQVPAAVADQFHAVMYRAQVVSSDTPQRVLDFRDALKKSSNNVTKVTISGQSYDAVKLIKWGVEKAGCASKVDANAVVKALTSIDSSDYPKDAHAVWVPNPAFTVKSHTTAAYDYSEFWALIGAVAPKDGLYEGEPFTVETK
jgi:branched-chain amino acid transport system substrate-binding protein